jgi:hypothetical protein
MNDRPTDTLRGGHGLSAGVRNRWRSKSARRRHAGGAAPKPERQVMIEALEPRVLLSADLDLLGTTAITSSLGAPAPSGSPVQVDLAGASAASTLDAAVIPSSTLGIDAPVISGSIDVPGETDRYAFTLTDTKRIVFDSLTNSSQITWSLTGPRGVEVNPRRFDQSDASSLAGSPVLALGPGNYTLTVDGTGDATGAYAFRLLDLSHSRQVTYGEAVTASLPEADRTAAFQFTAADGDEVFFQRTALTGQQPQWRLLGPDNRELFGASSFDNVDVRRLTGGGLYTLLVEGPVTNTGAQVDFGFTLHRATTDSTSVQLGQIVTGNIEWPGRRDAFTFTLDGAKRLYFDSLSNDPAKNWTLTGPRGVEVLARNFHQSDASSFSGNAALDLPQGTYTVMVDAAGANTGTYAFRLLDLSAATPIALDNTVSGLLGDGVGVAGIRVASGAPLTYPAGVANGALSITNSTSYVTVPDAVALRPAALTLEAWVRRDAAAPEFATVAMKTSSASWTDGYGLYATSDGFINFFVTHWSNVRVRTALPADQWAHVAGTYDGTALRLYINGELAPDPGPQPADQPQYGGAADRLRRRRLWLARADRRGADLERCPQRRRHRAGARRPAGDASGRPRCLLALRRGGRRRGAGQRGSQQRHRHQHRAGDARLRLRGAARRHAAAGCAQQHRVRQLAPHRPERPAGHRGQLRRRNPTDPSGRNLHAAGRGRRFQHHARELLLPRRQPGQHAHRRLHRHEPGARPTRDRLHRRGGGGGSVRLHHDGSGAPAARPAERGRFPLHARRAARGRVRGPLRHLERPRGAPAGGREPTACPFPAREASRATMPSAC